MGCCKPRVLALPVIVRGVGDLSMMLRSRRKGKWISVRMLMLSSYVEEL
jgi:hypothetical protein